MTDMETNTGTATPIPPEITKTISDAANSPTGDIFSDRLSGLEQRVDTVETHVLTFRPQFTDAEADRLREVLDKYFPQGA